MILEVLSWMFVLVLLGILLFAAVALLSPFETLGWWAGWSQRREESNPIALAPTPLWRRDRTTDQYLVYLTGIAGFSGEFLGRRELGFLERLQARLPEAVIIHDVFPFSATNNPLDGDRLLSRLWAWLQQRRLRNPHTVLKNLIAIRNILQVAVSADPRYGPIYNVGVAREIVRSLLDEGYPPGAGVPITLVGVSGGGQIALGTVRYLVEALQVPVYVIAVAGVLSDDPSISCVEHLYQLKGSKDRVPLMGEILYPGRWPMLRYSAWNKARQEGKITVIDTGPMTHMGHDEYFSRSAVLSTGQSHADHTAEIIADIVKGTVMIHRPVSRARLALAVDSIEGDRS